MEFGMESGGKVISPLAAAETRWTFNAFRLIPTGLRREVTHGPHEIWFLLRLCKCFALKQVRTPVAIFGSLGVCIYVPASRHWLISYSPIHLTYPDVIV